MITTKKLGENPYKYLTNAEFLKEFDTYMESKSSKNLGIYATFTMCLLVEYDRRFRPAQPDKGSEGKSKKRYFNPDIPPTYY